jgi:hypothetical protein
MSQAIQVVQTRASDLLQQFATSGAEIWKRAYDDGKNLSWFLETEDPSTGYPNEDTDAFQRIMREANIRVRSFPEWGVASDEVRAFEKAPGALWLLPEYMSREWRRAKSGKSPNMRAFIGSKDVRPVRPEYYVPEVRWEKAVAPQIPISALVARTTPIDSNSYKAYYLKDDPVAVRKVRVAEAAEIPGAKLVGAEREIPLYKYGRKLVMSYEALRRMRIDQVSFYVQRMAVQAEVDKLQVIMDTIVSGDGNPGTAAAVVSQTSMGGTAAQPITLKVWQNFKKTFKNPYILDTVFALPALVTDLELISTGSSNIPMMVLQGSMNINTFRPINPALADAVAVGWTDTAPAAKYVAMDSRLAIEQVTEIGSTINEVQRFITSQTEALTFTETEGYAVLDPNGTKILDMAT